MAKGQRQAEQGARSAVGGLPVSGHPGIDTDTKSTGFGAITDPIAKGLSSLTAPISGAISAEPSLWAAASKFIQRQRLLPAVSRCRKVPT
jgi:hypothetical protein